MDGAEAFHLDRARFVDQVADDVHDASERTLADRHRNRAAGVSDLLAADEPFRRVHGDAPQRVLAELLSDFENEPVAVVVRHERVQNSPQIAVKRHVDDGADHLRDPTGCVRDNRHFDVLVHFFRVAAEPG